MGAAGQGLVIELALDLPAHAVVRFGVDPRGQVGPLGLVHIAQRALGHGHALQLERPAGLAFALGEIPVLAALGVLCGGFTEASLRQAGCIAIYRDPEDLLILNTLRSFS